MPDQVPALTEPAPAADPARVVVATSLDPATVDRFYTIYHAAFLPLQISAAARHMLTVDEFAEEMTDPRIHKYVAVNDGVAVGLTTIAVDLEAVPWIEPMFYRHRYPAEHARGALRYLGFTLVDPGASTYRAFVDMIDAVGTDMLAQRTVCGFDFCTANAVSSVGRMVSLLPRRYGAVVAKIDTHHYGTLDFRTAEPGTEPAPLDTQHYYTADFSNPTKPPAPTTRVVPPQRTTSTPSPLSSHQPSGQ